MVNIWVFFRISRGLFDSAVALDMGARWCPPLVKAVFLFSAKISGAIAASGIVLGLFPTKFNGRKTLIGNTSLEQGAFIEGIMTEELVFHFHACKRGEKHRATCISPLGIGLAVFIAEMFGVFYTGGSLTQQGALVLVL